jgi:hypothetical protein
MYGDGVKETRKRAAGGPAGAGGARRAFRNKRGSSAVFLTIILSAILLLTGVLIRAAGLSAGKSYGDLVFQTAGRSLLSEFDSRLYADYGLFAMRSDEEQTARKLLHYGDASLKNGGRAGAVWLLPCDVTDIRVRLSDFSLLDAGTFEDQILKDIKFITVNNLVDKLRPGSSAPVATNPVGSEEPRSINNQTILNGLPSKGLGGSGPSAASMLASGLPSAGELFSGGTDSFFVTEYIMARFSHAYAAVPNLAAGHARFFQNEAEYIIMGGFDDAENLKDVEGRLRLLRFALNEVFIHSDRELTAQVNALAASLSVTFPGVPPIFFRELIYAAWVAVETENDLKLLRSGKKVALIKQHDNWATEIKVIPKMIMAFMNRDTESGEGGGIAETSGKAASGMPAVSPRDESGFSYGDYLRLFLFFTSRENKLMRIMDLIQINMKIGYYESFLIREHYVGLRYELDINGSTYSYRQSYDAIRGGE